MEELWTVTGVLYSNLDLNARQEDKRSVKRTDQDNSEKILKFVVNINVTLSRYICRF